MLDNGESLPSVILCVYGLQRLVNINEMIDNLGLETLNGISGLDWKMHLKYRILKTGGVLKGPRNLFLLPCSYASHIVS